MPIEITPHIAIPDEELEWKFIRASGPGGQNVNKVSSAVQLRFLLPLNSSLPVSARNRLRAIAGQKMVDDGSILFTARSERSQEQNRRAAAERLAALIRTALVEPKIRELSDEIVDELVGRDQFDFAREFALHRGQFFPSQASEQSNHEHERVLELREQLGLDVAELSENGRGFAGVRVCGG